MKIKTKVVGGTLRLPIGTDDPSTPPPRGCG
jgi:hypothetical protein